jgi:inhibitor of KinA
MNKPKLFPLGETAVTVDFGNRISAELNDRVLSLAKRLDEKPFAGFIETVPAYSSLTVFYDVFKIRTNNPKLQTAFDFVCAEIEKALLEMSDKSRSESRLMKIPICFDREFASDLDFVAAEKNLSSDEVIEIFLAETYRVFMLGFLPGFAYMGEVSEKIATARKSNPRVRVPLGSVGIAGIQTGIYSLESPGGWQIIGRTPLKMFDRQNEPPTLLQAGDQVQFYSIDKTSFTELKQNQSEMGNPKWVIE